MANDETKDTSYLSLVPNQWREDPSVFGAVVRGYSSGLADSPNSHQYEMDAVRALILPMVGRFRFSFITLADQEPQRVFHEVVTFHDSEIRLNLDIRQGMVPAGHYACLALPLYDEDESYITRRADAFQGLLTLISGHTAMLDLVFEQRFDWSQPDQVSRVSKAVESHIHPSMWRVFSLDTLHAVKTAFESCPPELRARAELAFSYIARSTNVIDHAARYSNTWIALEIAAGGHKAVRIFLNGLDPAFAGEAKRFIDMRNALFHHGQRPIFEQADERFLCACVLALFLQQLGITDPAFSILVIEHLEHQRVRDS